MHEISIVRNVFDTLQETYPDKFERISKVQMEAGLLSNIQPILIQNAFEALIVEEPGLADIELEVVQLPIIAHCEACEKDFEVVRHKFVCTCGTPSRKIVQGEELQISKVEFIGN
ncbi:hydrogenase maturation nickel metallochaperone HypA/HybF [Pontibacter chinhatensis]|uniref:Hydrogenase-3 nickel incorporation protein HypA n=1 Tax=Pontibacter chinhatensis TaxID=1436961 RepID=A0A1I2P4X4_9BACT|nr:hydrogenase maturation nickel metallochaperone HypA [Pontibacter chinhatensis]SFG08686.1 Hydrogenase-3 nickel incorporation protein HypA [Pontibacter chinhatensis]